jgi:ribosomal protein S4
LLEQRLDSTILRLFHFKPSLIKHPFQVKQLNKLEGSFGQKKTKNRIRTNPLTSFTPLQIKQMINHGHVFVNGKKVKSGNFSLKTLDQIEVKGFISDLKKKYTKGSHELVKPTNKSLFKTEGLKRLNLIKGTLNTKKDSLKFIKSKLNKQTFSAEPSSIVEGKSLVLKSKPLLNKKESKFYKTLEKQTNTNLKVCNEGNFVLSNYVQLQKNHRKTLLLKGFENQPYLEDLNEKCKPGSEKPILPLKDGSLNISVSAEEKNIDVCEFLRLSKLKRFTEAFYITYRNLHFLERDFGLIDNTRNPKIETKRNFLKSRLEEVGQSFLKSQIEENMGPLFNRFGLDQSIYALSTLSPLLKSNN